MPWLANVHSDAEIAVWIGTVVLPQQTVQMEISKLRCYVAV